MRLTKFLIYCLFEDDLVKSNKYSNYDRTKNLGFEKKQKYPLKKIDSIPNFKNNAKTTQGNIWLILSNIN